MSARGPRPAPVRAEASSARARAGTRIARIPLNLRLLVVGADFGGELGAGTVASAIARGLQRGGLPEPDLLALARAREGAAGRHLAAELRAELEDERLHERLLAARAIVIAAAELRPHTLAASPAFELATRARQNGVPAYAITARNELDAFQARILDLQLIIEAPDARALGGTGRRLAHEVLAGIG